MNLTDEFYEGEDCDWLPKSHYFRHTGDIFENFVFEKGGFLKPDLLILDDGCGDGRLMEKIDRNQTIVGIDISSRQLEIAKKRSLSNAHFIKSSVTHLPFKDDVFDRVFSWSVLIHVEHSEDRLIAVGEIGRILKNDGTALVLLKNYPSLFYHMGSFAYRLLKGKKISTAFKKENYYDVAWADARLYLYRSTYSEIKRMFHDIGMKIDWIKTQGFLLPDEFDIVLNGIMSNRRIGKLLGGADRAFSNAFPKFSNYMAYVVSKHK